MTSAVKSCSRCLAEKPVEAFYATKVGCGRDSRCKACRLGVAHEADAAGRRRATAKYDAKHKDARREKRRIRDAANREHMRELSKRWYRANPARYAKKRIDRRQSVKQATPAWSNTFFVEEAYRLARMRTATTGIKWHVDHIVPLKNDLVCGLHAHTNIQVIPATVNHRKSNHLVA